MTTPLPRIAVLASTRGTDLQALIDAINAGTLHAEIVCVVSNKNKCYALERARNAGIKTYAGVKPEATAEILQRERVQLVVLVGYMQILPSEFVRKFHKKIINIHPALIPKFSGKAFFGKSVHEAVLASGDTESGMTIHYVDEGVDTGEIILQKTCPILPDDTPERLKDRVQALEKEWYPKVVEMLLNKK